jgi:chromosome segregation ATPase
MVTVNDNPIVLYATGIIGVLLLILSFSQKLGGALEKWASARRRAAQEANEEYTNDLKERLEEVKGDLSSARKEIAALRTEIKQTQDANDNALDILRAEYREERTKWEQREVNLVAENWKFRKALAEAGIDPNTVTQVDRRQGDVA